MPPITEFEETAAMPERMGLEVRDVAESERESPVAELEHHPATAEATEVPRLEEPGLPELDDAASPEEAGTMEFDDAAFPEEAGTMEFDDAALPEEAGTMEFEAVKLCADVR
jgi:hypothetical protein